ncbi:LacI family DNA-binding transcriptional regulator [Streptococcus equi]|nr:LacI family DNA-binding transcriptional regulator [Streptococcus equi]
MHKISYDQRCRTRGGSSVATVSYVINKGRSKISPETRNKVLQMINL